ncbi:MAG: efflux transporter outer membrane subunit [Syntrophales bacterium]|nr:efflux transporter outer membrane subunit [Syntrophales bacterium]
MMKLKWFFTVLAVFVLGACSLAPKYSRPAAPVPSGWPAGTAYKVTEAPAAPAAADLKWQDFYTDARLRQVIETVLKNSRDIRLAALNVERARGLYGIQRAELLPSVNAAGSYARQRIAADQSFSGNASVTEQYTVSLGVAAWELDFFGRIRSLKDRALEEFFATDQARLSTQILLMSEAANAWLTLAADRENLKLARSTLEAQEASWKLIRRRYDLGMASELDLQRIQSQVDTARGEVARFMQLEALDENALNLLAGTTLPPELLPNDLAGVSPPLDFSAGLSSEMLLRRPDVLAAEHQLKAANANIGAARAAFLPRISLTTSIGSASADLGGLFKTGSGIWSFAPVVSVPVFDARTWSAYDVTKADREIMIARYEKAIQSAFRDVADALAVKGTVDLRIAAQESLVRAFSETYRLANLRYEKGIDSYLSVLDAQRSLFGAQQGLIALYRARMSNQVTLYGVLGGGVQ